MTSHILTNLQRGITYAWDWPNVSGSDFSDRDHKRFKELSAAFTSVSGIAAMGVALASGCSMPVAMGASAAGVIAGHYLAGAVVVLDR